MSGSEAVNTLNDLLERFDGLRSNLAKEINRLQGDWNYLGRAGVQRDDHAAELLKTLIGPLGKIKMFTFDCMEQISKISKNPFSE